MTSRVIVSHFKNLSGYELSPHVQQHNELTSLIEHYSYRYIRTINILINLSRVSYPPETTEISGDIFREINSRDIRLKYTSFNRRDDLQGEMSDMNDNFTPHPEISQESLHIYKELYTAAWKLCFDYIIIFGRPVIPLGTHGEQALRKALRLFQDAVELVSHEWEPFWTIGKIYERLGEYENALEYFDEAYKLCTVEVAIPKEACRMALELGDHERALAYSSTALSIAPGDCTLWTNNALILILLNKLDDAAKSIAQARNISSTNTISHNIAILIDLINMGRVDPPKVLSDFHDINLRKLIAKTSQAEHTVPE